MNGNRRHSRAKLERKCDLIGRDGVNYPASLDDISLSGALITVVSETHFKTGDLCDFMLRFKTTELPLKRTCKIARIDSKIIGVEFLT